MSPTRNDSFRDNDRPKRLTAILSLCQRMNSITDLGAILDLLVREAAGLMDAERATIFLLDPTKTELLSQVALGSDQVIRCDATRGIAGAALAAGEVLNIPNAYQDPRFNNAVDRQTGYRTRNLLASPLVHPIDGETIGVFEVLNRKVGPFVPSGRKNRLPRSIR